MGTPPAERRSASSQTSSYLTLLVVGLLVVAPMSFGVVGTATGATGVDTAGDTHDTAAVGPVRQTPFVSGTNSLADANTTFAGAGTNDTFGAALAHGDLNGDGVEDIVVGAPENDSAGGNNSGAVYVFYGPVEASDVDAAAANVTLHGVDPGDRAGYAVAAGDVDDDGADDLVVGAPLEDANGQSAGTAYVLDGGDALPANASLSAAAHVLRGEAEGDRAGWSVAVVNRTGGDDVLVGAPGGDDTAPDAGAAYVVSDADPGVDSLANATATLTGVGEGDAAGWVVAEAGDFDGDGRQDVVVSAPRNNSTAADAGATYLLTENVTGTVSLADAHLKLRGEAARDRAGWDAAEAGDVNNDSYDDLVVGAPFAETDDGETNAGIAYVVYGGPDDAGTVNLSAAGATLAGSGEDDYAGYSVSSAGSGDVTCDEYADVLVGAPGNNSTAVDAGAVYVVAGSEFPATERNLSTADATLTGEGAGDRAGAAVSDAMDVTGNGDKDVLVGAPGNNSTAVGAGAAYLVAGDCPEPGPEPEPEPEPEPDDVIVDKDCVDEQGEVTITNPNDERVTFTIEGDSYTLAANGTDGDSITLDDLDDGDYQWSATTTEDGEHVGGGVLTVDCDEPEPEDVVVTLDCDDEQGELTVVNPNDQEVTFTIEGSDYTLAASGNDGDTLVLDNLDDSDYDWSATTTEDGEHVGGGVLTVDCDEPGDVIVDKDCDDEQGELTVTNPNDQNVTFTVEGTDYELTANGTDSDSITLSDLDDGDYQWNAETEDGTDVGGGTLIVECDEPEPEPTEVLVTLDCDDEQGELTVVNPNDQNVTFTIGGDAYTLTANGTANDTLVLDGLDDGEYQWNAETEDGTDVGGGTLTVDCDEPEPEDVLVTLDCIDEQGELTVVNPNDQNVTFTIGGDAYTLTANGTDSDSITLSDLDDGDYQWNAETEDGTDVGGGTLTVGCDPLNIDASAPDCGELRLENPTDERVYVQFIDQDQPGNEGEFIVEPGETKNVTTGNVSFQLTASTGPVSGADPGETVLVNGQEQVVVDVPDCPPEQPPSGAISDVTCQNVTLAADNVGQGSITFLVEFEDGTNTTETVETDDGSFSGVVAYDNPDDKNVSGVFLYTGNDTDTRPGGFLDDVDLDGLNCEPEPSEYDPEGSIVDATCQETTVEVENVTEGFVTVVVTFGDGTTQNLTAETDDGSFSGTLTIDNPDDKNVSSVDLFAGEPGEGPDEQFIDDRTLNLDCSPDDGPEVDPGNVTLTALCTDAEDDLAQYRITNDNDQAVTVTYDVYGTDESGEVTVDANSEETIVVNASDDSATVRLFYGGEQIDVKANNPEACDLGEPNVDPGDITLTALCTDAEDDLAQYRITNDNDQAVTVTYDVYGQSDSDETVEVPANGEVTVTVDTDDNDEATVRLFYDGEQIDVKANNPDACDLGAPNEEPVDPDDITLTAICTDAEDDLAQYRITNDNDQNVTVTYDSYGVGGSQDSVEVPANDEATVTVSTGDDDEATARLFYDGEQIDVKANNPEACDLGEPNVDPSDITLTALCTDAEDDLAKYRITNDNDQAVTVTYDSYGESGSEESIEVPANDEVTVTVPTGDDDEATARLFYDGNQIDVKGNNPESCDLGQPNEPDIEDLGVSQSCDGEQGAVTFSNPNDVNVSLTFDGDPYTVPANDQLTIDDLDDGGYDWSGETDGGEAAGSGTATIDCDTQQVDCEGQTKFEWTGSSYSEEFSSLDVTISGNEETATITNNEPFAVDVYVKSGSEQAGAGVSGPFTVAADSEEDVTGTSGKDISAVGIVCEGTGTPNFPPFTLPSDNSASLDASLDLPAELTDKKPVESNSQARSEDADIQS